MDIVFKMRFLLILLFIPTLALSQTTPSTQGWFCSLQGLSTYNPDRQTATDNLCQQWASENSHTYVSTTGIQCNYIHRTIGSQFDIAIGCGEQGICPDGIDYVSDGGTGFCPDPPEECPSPGTPAQSACQQTGLLPSDITGVTGYCGPNPNFNGGIGAEYCIVGYVQDANEYQYDGSICEVPTPDLLFGGDCPPLPDCDDPNETDPICANDPDDDDDPDPDDPVDCSVTPFHPQCILDRDKDDDPDPDTDSDGDGDPTNDSDDPDDPSDDPDATNPDDEDRSLGDEDTGDNDSNDDGDSDDDNGVGGDGPDSQGDCDPANGGCSGSSADCSNQPQCTGDPIQCAILNQEWYSRCGGTHSDLGNCESTFECDGDPLLCAQIRFDHRAYCATQPTENQINDPSNLSNFLEGVDDGSDWRGGPDIEGSERDITEVFSDLDDSGLGFDRQCIQDFNISTTYGSIAVPISQWCPYLEIVGWFVIFLAYLHSAYIIFRTISQ